MIIITKMFKFLLCTLGLGMAAAYSPVSGQCQFLLEQDFFDFRPLAVRADYYALYDTKKPPLDSRPTLYFDLCKDLTPETLTKINCPPTLHTQAAIVKLN